MLTKDFDKSTIPKKNEILKTVHVYYHRLIVNFIVKICLNLIIL